MAFAHCRLRPVGLKMQNLVRDWLSSILNKAGVLFCGLPINRGGLLLNMMCNVNPGLRYTLVDHFGGPAIFYSNGNDQQPRSQHYSAVEHSGDI